MLYLADIVEHTSTHNRKKKQNREWDKPHTENILKWHKLNLSQPGVTIGSVHNSQSMAPEFGSRWIFRCF